MGKLKQKGKAGAASNYITRNQALKKLQVNLADFRRLCILKGIYPREPKNKKKANKGSTAPATFYYTKDIQYLLHEPILDKFREYKIFVKKLSKALAKQQIGNAKRLEENKPLYTLDHIIKERYPTFTDALRDLDDALCMLFLFATFPSTDKVKNETVVKCQRLSSEFQHYVMKTRCLRKVFLSIKGIYYQAEIKGQTTTWVVPYHFSQQVPDDVDFRIMLTFLEFYQTLVGFVNYKLFTDVNLIYPPQLDKVKDEAAAGLNSFIIEPTNPASNLLDGVKKQDTKVTKEELIQLKESEQRVKTLDQKLSTIQIHDDKASSSENQLETPQTIRVEDEPIIDDFNQAATNNRNATDQPDTQLFTYGRLKTATIELQSLQTLFSNCMFYLSREVPRYSLEFVIRTFGGQVGWDATVGAGSPFEENDQRITHQICDRQQQGHKFLTRRYVQPQWVYDCVNARKLLLVEPYFPGKMAPPHLSPFVEYKEGDYVPEDHFAALGENERIKGDNVGEPKENTEEEGNESEEDENEEDENEDEEIKDQENDESEDIDEPDIEAEVKLRQKELEAEAKGISFSTFQQQEAVAASKKPSSRIAGKKRTHKELQGQEIDEKKEEKELAKIMMTKKQKKLYNKIEYGIRKKERKVTDLLRKKEEFSKKKDVDNEGKKTKKSRK